MVFTSKYLLYIWLIYFIVPLHFKGVLWLSIFDSLTKKGSLWMSCIKGLPLLLHPVVICYDPRDCYFLVLVTTYALSHFISHHIGYALLVMKLAILFLCIHLFTWYQTTLVYLLQIYWTRLFICTIMVTMRVLLRGCNNGKYRQTTSYGEFHDVISFRASSALAWWCLIWQNATSLFVPDSTWYCGTWDKYLLVLTISDARIPTIWAELSYSRQLGLSARQ